MLSILKINFEKIESSTKLTTVYAPSVVQSAPYRRHQVSPTRPPRDAALDERRGAEVGQRQARTLAAAAAVSLRNLTRR